MNAIGADAMQMLQAGVQEASRNFSALVVGNEGEHFSAGANLMLVLLEAQEENWTEIDVMVRTFQQTNQMLRYADVPVVIAPGGLTLGGGCEIALHGDRVQAAAETYIGLVEVGVGLIPAGGGTKEMIARAVESAAPNTTDYLPVIQRAFETIAFAKTSTSAPDAQRLGFLRDVDGITPNRERLIADAKTHALSRVREGYQAPATRAAILVGGDTVLAPLKLGIHLAWRRDASATTTP
jgi:3-hydroxyacyl-CoA dehydrogenase